ncbi:GNAT family N-acetyltransferase [Candidatus Pacearchaeota archaeon]|nr:GNAT family N-acetyltransferase [Candidatus Aenigmarchaeota archaeon]MBS3074784.1 GNAT family N-acetyltransferase [Candidatus Pacearchaeota archaeon]
MNNIKITLATKKDKNYLLSYFEHYKIKGLIENRVNCYILHNFTVIARTNNKIIGVLQWYIKEDPRAGVVEFEEVHVSEKYRNKGVGDLLIKFAIRSVRDYFKKIQIKPRKIFLFVEKNNKAAISLYKKYKFKFISEVGRLFSDKEIQLFYSRNL